MQADHIDEIDPAAPVTEQASAWWLLLNEGAATDADRHAFAEWVARSPERVSAYLRAAQVAHAFRSPRAPWPDTSVDELIRMAATPEVTRLPVAVVGEGASRRWMRFAPRVAVAALLVLVVVVSGYWVYPRPSERIETALGEQHSVVLSDGSLVTLNTTSEIELHFSNTHRGITLLEGEALFQVAHDVSRPFEVKAGEVTVRALGTKFNVDSHSQVLKVTVVEGRVEVSTGSARVPLGAGELLTLRSPGEPTVSRANVAMATAWTQRQLIFENRPLGEVAAEINRYNRRVIEIQSAELRGREVTGVFQANDPATFVAFLGSIPGVTIDRSTDPSRYIVRLSERP